MEYHSGSQGEQRGIGNRPADKNAAASPLHKQNSGVAGETVTGGILPMEPLQLKPMEKLQPLPAALASDVPSGAPQQRITGDLPALPKDLPRPQLPIQAPPDGSKSGAKPSGKGEPMKLPDHEQIDVLSPGAIRRLRAVNRAYRNIYIAKRQAEDNPQSSKFKDAIREAEVHYGSALKKAGENKEIQNHSVVNKVYTAWRDRPLNQEVDLSIELYAPLNQQIRQLAIRKVGEDPGVLVQIEDALKTPLDINPQQRRLSYAAEYDAMVALYNSSESYRTAVHADKNAALSMASDSFRGLLDIPSIQQKYQYLRLAKQNYLYFLGMYHSAPEGKSSEERKAYLESEGEGIQLGVAIAARALALPILDKTLPSEEALQQRIYTRTALRQLEKSFLILVEARETPEEHAARLEKLASALGFAGEIPEIVGDPEVAIVSRAYEVVNTEYMMGQLAQVVYETLAEQLHMPSGRMERLQKDRQTMHSLLNELTYLKNSEREQTMKDEKTANIFTRVINTMPLPRIVTDERIISGVDTYQQTGGSAEAFDALEQTMRTVLAEKIQDIEGILRRGEQPSQVTLESARALQESLKLSEKEIQALLDARSVIVDNPQLADAFAFARRPEIGFDFYNEEIQRHPQFYDLGDTLGSTWAQLLHPGQRLGSIVDKYGFINLQDRDLISAYRNESRLREMRNEATSDEASERLTREIAIATHRVRHAQYKILDSLLSHLEPVLAERAQQKKDAQMGEAITAVKQDAERYPPALTFKLSSEEAARREDVYASLAGTFIHPKVFASAEKSYLSGNTTAEALGRSMGVTTQGAQVYLDLLEEIYEPRLPEEPAAQNEPQGTLPPWLQALDEEAEQASSPSFSSPDQKIESVQRSSGEVINESFEIE